MTVVCLIPFPALVLHVVLTMSQNYFDCGLVLLLFALHFSGDFSHSPKPEKLLQLQLQLRWRQYDGVLLTLL